MTWIAIASLYVIMGLLSKDPIMYVILTILIYAGLNARIYWVFHSKKRRQHMRKIIILLAFLLMAGTAYAAPFLVSDPNTSLPETYEITGLPAPLNGTGVPAQADGSLKFDLAQCPIGGPYNLTVKVCKGGVWGSCSASVPFVFSRPEAASAPANIRLSK